MKKLEKKDKNKIKDKNNENKNIPRLLKIIIIFLIMTKLIKKKMIK